jgi:hypothetical protein
MTPQSRTFNGAVMAEMGRQNPRMLPYSAEPERPT